MAASVASDVSAPVARASSSRRTRQRPGLDGRRRLGNRRRLDGRRRLGLPKEFGDLGLDVLVEAPAQAVVVLGQFLDRLRRSGQRRRRPWRPRRPGVPLVLPFGVRPPARSSSLSPSSSSPSSSSSARSVNSIPRRSTAPVRFSGSAAAIMVSHSVARSAPPRPRAGPRMRMPALSLSGSPASRIGSGRPPSAPSSTKPRGRRFIEVQTGAGLDDSQLRRSPPGRGSRPDLRTPGAARRSGRPCARSQSASTAR